MAGLAFDVAVRLRLNATSVGVNYQKSQNPIIAAGDDWSMAALPGLPMHDAGETRITRMSFGGSIVPGHGYISEEGGMTPSLLGS
jgi:hypothetical protein